LFLSIGDRWASDPAQDLSDDLGSIIRIRTDGSIPDDNPFRWLTGARPGMQQPVRYWVPLSIAASGLAVEGDPSHESLWISALAGEMLVRLTFGDNCAVSEEHFLKNRLGRLRDVRIDPSGLLYVLTHGPEGMLYRLDRAPDDADETAKTHL
jgi:glucose/arabinose dehydrogenase